MSEIHQLISLPPETELDHWIVDRISSNLADEIAQCPNARDIYAIAVGLEPTASYLEGLYNTNAEWAKKEGNLPIDSENTSKWSTALWTTLEDTFFVIGSNEKPEESISVDKWIREAKSLPDRDPYIDRYWSLVVAAIKSFRKSRMYDLIGKDVPVICQMSYYYDTGWEATRQANPEGQAASYFCDLKQGRTIV